MSAAILVFLSLLSPAAIPPNPAAVPAKAAAASKVWTNEDVEALESTGSLSIIGQPETAQPAAPAAAATETQSAPAPAAPYVKEQDPDWYVREIGNRRDQIDQIDGQIQEIQQTRATGEGISDVIPLAKTAPGITPEATIEVVQDQKNHLEAEISDLQDLAQSNYIERDAWR